MPPPKNKSGYMPAFKFLISHVFEKINTSAQKSKFILPTGDKVFIWEFFVPFKQDPGTGARISLWLDKSEIIRIYNLDNRLDLANCPILANHINRP